jgi:hypothetical protein
MCVLSRTQWQGSLEGTLVFPYQFSSHQYCIFNCHQDLVRQFSRLLAAEVFASAVVMLDTLCSEVVWRVLATHSIRQFPLHFPSRALPCALTFQLESIYKEGNGCPVTCKAGIPGGTGVAIPILDLGLRREWVVSATVDLPAGKRTGIHWTGGWMRLGAVMDGSGNLACIDVRISGPSRP